MEPEENVKRKEIQKAPLGFPGTKWRSLEHILPHLPIQRKSRWIDHFGGTGVVSFNVPECEVMVLNDRNSAIIDFYRAVRDRRDELIAYLESFHPASREEWHHARMLWIEETDTVKRAALWYYMVRLSVLQKGHCFGRGLNSRLNPMPESLKLFIPISNKLKAFTIENQDARVLAADFDAPNAVHYFDPPYVGTDQGMYKHKWSWKDMSELLQLIGQLKGYVALSHYPDSRIDEAVDWTHRYEWKIEGNTSEPQVFREENAKAGKESVMEQNTSTEVLWIKETH